MRFPQILVALSLLSAALVASGQESFQSALQRGSAAAPAQHAFAAQYSFADIYRLAVAAPAAAGLPSAPAGDTPIRVAATQAPAQFSIAEVREPQLWVLLLAGLAAAVWVARRRLGYGF
jgi:hypothetical protein